jgi:hypothetical protein
VKFIKALLLIGLFSIQGAFGQIALDQPAPGPPDPDLPSPDLPASPGQRSSHDQIVSPDQLIPDPLVPDQNESPGINWRGLFLQSFQFLAVEHGFRYLNEEGTRHPHMPFFRGYVKSLGNLHGWADGDPFYVNYVGHPMEGSTAGFIFAQNDTAFQGVELGKNSRYWKSRLRATIFSWAYSEQFEIGLISEASIGNIQAYHPATGFVDHVATPTIGLAWMLAEDTLDRFLVKPVEQHTRNRMVVTLVRGFATPSRSMANMMANRVPWYRETRPDPWEYYRLPPPVIAEPARNDYPLVSSFEILLTTRTSAPFGLGARGACIGGGGEAAFRITEHFQLVGDVGGCKLTSLGDNFSGDSLTYMAGPRWTPRPAARWQPFLQALVGGRKITQELMDPQKKAQLEAAAVKQGLELGDGDHASYTQTSEASGFALSAGGGVDLKLSSALGLRLGKLEYLRSWHSHLNGIDYTNSAEFTSGLILRFGTW